MDFQNTLCGCSPPQVINLLFAINDISTVKVYNNCDCEYDNSVLQYAYSLDNVCWTCYMSYDEILKSTGRVEFKTDNRPLFDFSVEEVNEAGWKLSVCTYDLHNDEKLVEGNVMTEYEERFSSQGNPICKLVAIR